MFLIAHNFKAVIATGVKPGIAILHDGTTLAVILHPTHFQFGHGNCECHTWSKVGRFMPQVGAPLFRVGI